ncbi:MAG: universal stress protein [Rudanella sp.]|nr:universal stress protein [Rudanella sp.]
MKARTVSAGLTDYLDQHPTDLLVMTTLERGFLANLINPSQTERMVVRSMVPVLVLHK